MSGSIMEKPAVFRHLILEGKPYDAGRTLGQYIRNETDPIRNLITDSPEKSSKESVQKAMEYFDRYCPGINDEIKGLADGLETAVENLLYYLVTFKGKGCCSQMALLPEITKDGHLYMARNYEYSPEESDLCLITSKIDGKAKHLGFSELMFGRTDGINEYGLCISMSNAVPGEESECEGFDFWAVIRAVLDTCADVDEAIELVQAIPTESFTNYMVADRKGYAALIEVAGNEKCVRRITNNKGPKSLFTTNHFISDEMLKYDRARYWDSVARFKAMDLRINDALPDVDKDVIKAIQSDKMPLGLCCHYYADRFGTLWSAIYDVTEINLEVCFGSPKINPWYVLDLNSPRAQEKYRAILPFETRPVWKKLPPGAADCLEFEPV